MIFLITSILFYFYNYLYIKIWKKISTITPKGAGIILIIPLVYLILNFDLKLFFLISILLFSFIYYLDDLFGLSPLLRLLIQILTPMMIYFYSFKEFNCIYFPFVILFFFIVVNTLNFQDGEDLNLASVLFLIFITFFYFTSNLIIKDISKLILLYLFIFGIFNKKKNNLYFGDAGCYIISILSFLFIIIDFQNLFMVKIFLSVIFFPIIEIFLVTFYRIYKKQNLFSRNYYYIYQILAQKTKWKIYILPNIFFAFANNLISIQLNLDTQLILILFFSNIIFSLFLRFLISKLPNYNEN
jgi:UDP-GlcNAc:undecaprenyl-phosphate/decaprenyl-phosphate GlcNAc-1-phosphate transferase